MRLDRIVVSVAAAAGLALTAAACGGTSSAGSGGSTAAANPNAPEQNPSGDIPDNQAFVAYTPPSGLFSVKVPEGWSRTGSGTTVTFTDKLNSIRLEQVAAATAPTAASFRSVELPSVQRATPGFQLRTVRAVTLPAGPALLAEYAATSAPDPVTGKTVAQDVQRYELWHGGQEVTVTLSSPRGADNVDPWRTVTESVRWLR